MNTPTKGTLLISNKLDIKGSTVAFKQWKKNQNIFGGNLNMYQITFSYSHTYSASKNLQEIYILSTPKLKENVD